MKKYRKIEIIFFYYTYAYINMHPQMYICDFNFCPYSEFRNKRECEGRFILYA